MARQVVVFSTPDCPTCRQQKAWLAQRGISYIDQDLNDVDAQENLRDLEKRLQRRLSYVPITVIDGKVYEGFDPNVLEQVLS